MFVRSLAAVAAYSLAACGQTAATSQSDAYVTAARGQVSTDRDDAAWAISSGETVRPARIITTGADGYARLEVAGGSFFEILGNSRVGFRQNAATAGDLMDLLLGRVRVHLSPGPGQPSQRVFTPTAVITAVQPATIAIAMDGNDTLRIDVLEGEVRVQHKLLPRSEPTVVKAVDAILVERNEQIVRRLDRGTLYRYGIKPLHDLFSVLTPKKSGQPIEQEQFLASR